MVVLEVSQISVKNWAVSNDESMAWDIYLQVYFERKGGKCRCCKRSRRHRDRAFSKGTDRVREASEMLWRRYNEDNFLVALFTLEGSSWRSLRHGEMVTLAVDVFRIPRSFRDGERGELLQVLRGNLQLGVWGVLTLLPQGADASGEDADFPSASLELRPRTMRPFLLEFARPECDYSETGTDTFGRKHRVSVSSQESWQSGSSSGGSHSLMPKMFNVKFSLQQPGMFAQKDSRCSTNQAKDERLRPQPRDPLGGDIVSPTGSHSPVSGSHSLTEMDHVRTMSSQAGAASMGLSRLTWNGRNSRAAPKPSMLGTRLRALVRRQLKGIADRRQKDAPKDYIHWMVDNWEGFWKSCWPGDQDLLREGEDVVPLMEAEFRKDCVIFFNTLFPRSHGEMFRVMRALAFDPVNSKVSFKLLSDTRPQAAGAAAASMDTGWLLDGGDVDERRFGEDFTLRQRITAQATEAARVLRRRMSRGNVGLGSPDAVEGTPSSSHKSVWFGVFAQSSFMKAGDAVQSSRSGSRSLESHFTMSMSSTNTRHTPTASVEADPIDVDLRNVDSDSDVEPVEDQETCRSRCRSGGEEDHEINRPRVRSAGEDRELKSSKELRPYHQPFNHQVVPYIVSTPKGVFVDEYSPRIMLLKRILLCFAVCGVYYTEVSNCSQLAELWPYPLAAVLGHGSRVLIRLEDIEASEFINFLMFGDPHCVDWKESGLPYPLIRRLFSTHSVQIDTSTGNLMERKLQVMSASDSLQNISDGIRRKHLGLNVPIGGVGNPSALGRGCFIEFTGRVVHQQGGEDSEKDKLGGSWSLSRRTRPARFSARSSTDSPNNPDNLPKSRRLGFNNTASPTSSACVEPLDQRCFTAEEDANGLAERKSENSQAGSETSFVLNIDTTPRTDSEPRQEVASAMSTPRGEAKQKGRGSWRILPNIQGGHLYIRIDDFGEQTSRCGTVEGSAMGSKRWASRRWLLKPPRGYNAALEQAKLKARTFSSCSGAGELFFSSRVPEIRSTRSAGLQRTAFGGMNLLHMSSAPSLLSDELTSVEDLKWAKEVIVTTSRSPLRAPPSPLALKVVLDHFDSMNTQLFGRGGFRSVEDLFRELKNQRSFLLKRGQGLQRYLEPVILQLRWKGYILMLTHEICEDGDGVKRAQPRHSFVCASMRPDDEWRPVLNKIINNEFHLPIADFLKNVRPEAVDDNKCHTILEETMSSPSYPGLFSCYRTHMVQWDVKDDCTEFFEKVGLPVNVAARAERPNRCDFQSFGGASRRKRQRFWRWVPERTALQHQRFLNMEVKTADGRWAKYAFESEGVVQFPPTVEALTTLLSRCGLDLTPFGQGVHKQVEDFWLELMNQESYLMMSGGVPHRIVETLFVRIRWRDTRMKSNSKPWQVLVKSVKRCESQDRRISTSEEVNPRTQDEVALSLLNIKKYRDESWEECMMRCVTKDLGLTKQQLKGLCGHTQDDDARYAFHDLVRPSMSFPGISTLYRTHLVTLTLNKDYFTTPGLFVMGDDSERKCRLPGPPTGERQGSKKAVAKDPCEEANGKASPEPVAAAKLPEKEEQPAKRKPRPHDTDGSISFQPKSTFAPGPEEENMDHVSFYWASEDSVEGVHGMDLWAEARKREERHKVSSVLIGLEGTAPQRKSPFGTEHDASGTSCPVSATGGRKWRAYRKNNALQIPSDQGGMHLRITKPMFQEFVDTCDMLNLVEPSMDLVPEHQGSHTRDDLERRWAEKELFKQVLAGSGRQAKQVVEAMKEFAAAQRRPSQAYHAIHGRPQQQMQQQQPQEPRLSAVVAEGARRRDRAVTAELREEGAGIHEV